MRSVIISPTIHVDLESLINSRLARQPTTRSGVKYRALIIFICPGNDRLCLWDALAPSIFARFLQPTRTSAWRFVYRYSPIIPSVSGCFKLAPIGVAPGSHDQVHHRSERNGDDQRNPRGRISLPARGSSNCEPDITPTQQVPK
jgi:hypothetical protein